MSLLQYLLNASLCLVPFYLFYILLMRRFTFFTWNRWYIISSLLFCAIIPVLRIQPPETIQYVKFLPNLTMLPEQAPAIPVANATVHTVRSFDWITIAVMIYVIGVILAAIRLLYNLWQVVLMIRRGRKTAYENCWIVQGKHIRQNASFFHYIFLQQNLHEQEIQPVIMHERIHVRQWHTADVLLAECFKILLWFHPVVFHYKRLLQQVHEFEVDHEVATKTDKKEYAHLLLKLQNGVAITVANLFGAGNTRKRIEMLFTQKSIAMKKVFYLLTIPCLMLTATYCSRKQDAITVIDNDTRVQKKYGVLEESNDQISYILLPEKIIDLKDYHSFLNGGEFTEIRKLFEKYGVSARALTVPYVSGGTELCGFMLDGQHTEAQAFARVAEMIHKNQAMACTINKQTGKASVMVVSYDPTAGKNKRMVETGTGSFFINNDKELYLCINPAGFATLDDKKGLEAFIEQISGAFRKEGFTSVSLDVAIAEKDITSLSDIAKMTLRLENSRNGEKAEATFAINEMLVKQQNVICRVDKKLHTIRLGTGQMPLAHVNQQVFKADCAKCHTSTEGIHVPAADVSAGQDRKAVLAFMSNKAGF